MAGHSKFKNIMYRKGAQDAKRAKLFSKMAREITVAAKLGDKDPAMNSRLRSAIQAARTANMPKDNIERAIKKCGVGFMMAPRHHSAMRHVAGTRVELATRTLFNVLGPLSNPAGVTRQVTGVYSKNLVEPIAQALKNLGITKTWVVCGSDGMDELTTTGISYVASLDKGNIDMFEITPKDAGLPEATLSELKGGDSKFNAIAINEMLEGKLTPYRNIVLLNSAATLIVAEKANNLKEGIKMAEDSIDSGRAARVLECLVKITNS